MKKVKAFFRGLFKAADQDKSKPDPRRKTKPRKKPVKRKAAKKRKK